MSVKSTQYIRSGIVASVFMMAALSCLPATLSVLADSFGLSSSQLGRLATGELLGLLIGTTTSSTRTLGSLRIWTLVAAVTMVVINLAVPLGAPIASLLFLRFLAGFGAGLGFGLGLKLSAASQRPTRMFGLLNASLSATMILGFQSIPRLQASMSPGHWEGLQGGLAGAIFATYALLAGLSIFLVARMRLPPEAPSVTSGDRGFRLPHTPEMIGLLSIGLSFVAYGAVWAFLPLVGVAFKLPASSVANGTSVFAFMSLLGSIAIGSVSESVPRWLLGGASLVVVLVGLYALYGFGSGGPYVIGCALCGFYWPFNMPLVLGVLARLDRSGRSSILGGGMSNAGSALGPTFAALLIRGADYRPVGWMAAIMCAAAFGCLLVLVGRSSALLIQPPAQDNA